MDRTKRKRDSAICHGCGRRPDCQGCMEYCAFVDGVQDKDYNAQSKTHDVQHMLRQVRADLEKEMGEYDPDRPVTAIQLVNTLFEAAAVLTAMGWRSGAVHDDDKAKLGALNQHAWDGMAMINGPRNHSLSGPVSSVVRHRNVPASRVDLVCGARSSRKFM